MEMINGRKYRSHSHGDDNVALHYLPTPLKLSLDALWLNWLPSLPHLRRPDTTAAWEKFFYLFQLRNFSSINCKSSILMIYDFFMCAVFAIAHLKVFCGHADLMIFLLSHIFPWLVYSALPHHSTIMKLIF